MKQQNMSIKKSLGLLLCLIIPSAIALIIIVPMFSTDIPNWITLIVEVAIGLFIAIFLYIFQNKTSNVLRDLISDGVSTDFPSIDPVNNWRHICNSAIERIERIGKDISGILSAEKHLFDEIYRE